MNPSVFTVNVRAGLLTMATVLLLTSCATVTEKTTGWLSSNTEVIGALGGRILRGEANFARDREATFQLQTVALTQADPSALNAKPASGFSCFGPLRYTATRSGVVDLACSDGRSFVLVFVPLSPVSGMARDMSGRSDFTLTYGLPPEKAAGYLAVSPEQLLPPKSQDIAPAAGANPG